MSAIVYSVLKGSIAEINGIAPGFEIIKINGVEVFDILEYKFLVSDKKIKIEFLDNDKKKRKITIKNDYKDLGIEFENPLIDNARSCRNNCIFCFIDQLPSGMRETLYFKDDDSRLSFLHGNYVTLTNMSMDDVKRLAKIKISPINVSVHTTNPALRCKMLNNRFAGDVIEKMNYLAKHKITMNCQIVLCPGINDGEEMKNTLSVLSKLYPYAASVSVVPVGISKFRDGLYPLKAYDKETSLEVLNIVGEMQNNFLSKINTRFVYAADEFYIKAERPIPNPLEYEGFPQIENGVGMISSFSDEVISALALEDNLECNNEISIACGMAVLENMKILAKKCEQKIKGLKIYVYGIENDFFGHSITVSGLLTAGDIIKQLKDKYLGTKLLITKNMLKADEDIFLDDFTLEDFEKQIGVSVKAVPDDGFIFLDTIMDTENNL